MASLINAIPIRQKDLENCKRDIKQHLSNVRDFEVKNNIPPDLLAHIPPPVPPSQPGMPNVNPIRAPHPHVPGQPAPGDVMSPGAVRAPPPYTQMGGANNVYPGRPPMQQYIPPNGSIGHASFIQPKVESEQSQICSGWLVVAHVIELLSCFAPHTRGMYCKSGLLSSLQIRYHPNFVSIVSFPNSSPTFLPYPPSICTISYCIVKFTGV